MASPLFFVEVTIIKQPNSLCKNENCRKPFYACAYCTHTNAWRAVACSPECFVAYTEQVHVARKNRKNLNTKPERTDMTDEQLDELMGKPVEEVIEMTKEELKDYSEDVERVGFGGTVDMINEELRNSQIDAVDKPATSASSRKGRKPKATDS